MNYPDVTHWNVAIQQKITGPTGETVFRTVDRIEIWGSYFTKIEDQYLNGGYYIFVSGLNGSNQIIIEEGPVLPCPPGGCGDGQSCSASCVTPTYAWTAFYTANESGGDISLSITSAKKPITYEPFYQYFSNAQHLLLPSSLHAYYGVSSYNTGQGDKVIKLLDVTPADNIQDKDGVLLTGTVWGIQKWYGPWATWAGGGIGATNIAANFEDLCLENGEGAFTAVSIINTNSTSTLPDEAPTFECNGIPIQGPDGGEVPETEADFFELDCAELVIQLLDENGNMYEVIEQFDCTDEEQSGFNWPENIAVISLIPYNNINGTSTVLKQSDLYASNGDFIGQPITLDRGLYTVGIQFSDASYTTLFFESKAVSISTFPLSNFLTATAFPVPIVDDEFSLRLEAAAKIKFVYILSDLNGVELYRKNFVLQKDHNVVHVIKVHEGIPTGQLVNKFIFEDGSELVFQTIK